MYSPRVRVMRGRALYRVFWISFSHLLCYRNLPELSAADFTKLDISKFGWIHFEVMPPHVRYDIMPLSCLPGDQGRQPDQYRVMMEQVATYNSSQTNTSSRVKMSVELEKKRLCISELVPLADVVSTCRREWLPLTTGHSSLLASGDDE